MRKINEQLLIDTDQSKEEIDQSARLERDWGVGKGCEVFMQAERPLSGHGAVPGWVSSQMAWSV